MNIVITGASKGIGKAIALRFAKEGFDMAICARNREQIEITKKEILQLNSSIGVIAKSVDISDKKKLQEFGEMVLQSFTTIDVLVNNAGIFFPGAIHLEPENQLEKTMAVNLYGAYHLTRQLLPVMIQQRKGHIFNMCSTASLKAYPNGGAYSISKFALLGFSKNLREELKPHNIKVTAICPGPTLTDSWAGFEGPANRMMPAKDIAEVVWNAYSLSDQTVMEDIILRPMKGDIPPGP